MRVVETKVVVVVVTKVVAHTTLQMPPYSLVCCP